MAKSTPGIRNNNPGNIEYSPSTRWQGLDNPPSDGRFCRFKDPTYGIRAIAVTLITYQDKRKAKDGSRIDTVREIIERWAPPSENDTSAYVRHVRQKLGLGAEEYPGEVDVHDFEDCRKLVETIILHENGSQPYTDAQIEKGLRLAGVEPARPRSLQASRTVRGAQFAAGGGAVATAAGTISMVGPAVPVLRDIADFVRTYPMELLIGVGIAALIGAGIAVYAKWDERRKGIA